MPGLALRLVGSGLVLFGALVGLVRGLSYDDSVRQVTADLVAELQSCAPGPCVMGVQPGVTSVDDILALVNEHPWVEEIVTLENFYTFDERPGSPFRPPRVVWAWSSAAPDILAAEADLIANRRAYNADLINMPLNVPLGDVWLGFGPPDFVRQIPGGLLLVYGQLHVQVPLACQDRWQRDVTLILAGNPFPGERLSLSQMLALRCEGIE